VAARGRVFDAHADVCQADSVPYGQFHHRNAADTMLAGLWFAVAVALSSLLCPRSPPENLCQRLTIGGNR
jgi:hypothetical protein